MLTLLSASRAPPAHRGRKRLTPLASIASARRGVSSWLNSRQSRHGLPAVPEHHARQQPPGESGRAHPGNLSCCCGGVGRHNAATVAAMPASWQAARRAICCFCQAAVRYSPPQVLYPEKCSSHFCVQHLTQPASDS